MIFAIVLLILAAILLFYNTRENDRVEKDNLEIVTELERLYEEKLAAQEKEMQEESQNEQNADSEKKTSININGYDYMGIIYIPILDNLALPVLENYTYSNLKVSVCKYSGGIEEGNFTIAGHNYKSSFGKLSKLSVGNIAYFKDANGIVYKYTCTKIETLSPNQVEKMTTGNWDLTLFTCTYNNANRLAYRFELM